MAQEITLFGIHTLVPTTDNDFVLVYDTNAKPDTNNEVWIRVDTSQQVVPAAVNIVLPQISLLKGIWNLVISITDITGNAGISPINIFSSGADKINGASSVSITVGGGNATFNVVDYYSWAAFGNVGGSPSGIPSLQQVLNFDRDLANGNNFQGTGAGVGNTAAFVIGLGQNAAQNNTGNVVVALGGASGASNTASYGNFIGNSAGLLNSGQNVNFIGRGAGRNNGSSFVNGIGFYAAFNNSAIYVDAIGRYAAENNTGSYLLAIGKQSAANNIANQVIAIGRRACENNAGQDVVAIGDYAARNNSANGDSVISIGLQSGVNNSGKYAIGIGRLALNGNTANNAISVGNSSGQNNTGLRLISMGFAAAANNTGTDVIALGATAGISNAQSNRTIFSNDNMPTFPNRAAALAAITVPLGAAANNTYFYYNSGTGAIEAVRT